MIPENKLLDLLDVALSADTVHTVRQMRQVLDLGVDPLSLVSQLASLITNLLAGSFNMHQCEIREDGFFKRDFRKCNTFMKSLCGLFWHFEDYT